MSTGGGELTVCSNRSGANSAQLFIYCSVGPKTQANYSVKGPFLGLRNCKNVFLSFFQNNKLFKYDADISTSCSLKLKCRPLFWFKKVYIFACSYGK